MPHGLNSTSLHPRYQGMHALARMQQAPESAGLSNAAAYIHDSPSLITSTSQQTLTPASLCPQGKKGRRSHVEATWHQGDCVGDSWEGKRRRSEGEAASMAWGKGFANGSNAQRSGGEIGWYHCVRIEKSEQQPKGSYKKKRIPPTKMLQIRPMENK